MTFTKEEKLHIIETALSWIVAMAMFIYGAAKYIQLDRSAYLDKKISELTSMEIMWSFYGTSPAYAVVLGILEVTGAILILFKRTRILGGLITTTILMNVILQDIFYEVYLGALAGAVFYQLLILVIFWINRERLKKALQSILLKVPKFASKKRHYIILFCSFLLFLVLRVFEYFLTILAFR